MKKVGDNNYYFNTQTYELWIIDSKLKIEKKQMRPNKVKLYDYVTKRQARIFTENPLYDLSMFLNNM